MWCPPQVGEWVCRCLTSSLGVWEGSQGHSQERPGRQLAGADSAGLGLRPRHKSQTPASVTMQGCYCNMLMTTIILLNLLLQHLV